MEPKARFERFLETLDQLQAGDTSPDPDSLAHAYGIDPALARRLMEARGLLDPGLEPADSTVSTRKTLRMDTEAVPTDH